jgi:peptide/nickel transport system ATP-binding protein/oligopeptide transport system ATP-binding protein
MVTQPVTQNTEQSSTTPLLAVKDLVVHFEKRRRIAKDGTSTVHAVCETTFDVFAGETLSLVGESGCGKTTVARSILQLVKPTSGSIKFNGDEMVGLSRKKMKPFRQNLQIVFQDPFASLDPKMTVGTILAEPLVIHDKWDKSAGPDLIAETLRLVGLDPIAANRYPNEFSGGQRQRIGIARALILRPQLVLLDEPVSALDVSIQSGIINLLDDLQASLGISYLMISHDLSVVRHVSNRVAVMYLGRIVEVGDKKTVFNSPQHPYTQALLSAAPLPDPTRERNRQRIVLEGDVPSPTNPPSGCRFRTRCWKATDLCATEQPPLTATTGGHAVACHFPEVRSVL